jgi:DNA polymerase III delta prime subunit
MQLIPPTIPPDMPSDGEKLVFELLAADEAGEAADGWTALHSQDIAHHVRQMQGEADFVVVAPGLGVLVLEVKGCHTLRRDYGLWYYGADAAGDPRGPFKQASEAMHSLRERIAKHRPHLEGVLFQSAVCFPFVEFTDESEEWHPWQVLDKVRLGQRSIADCVAAALRQGRERVAGLGKSWFDPSAGEPTQAQCDEIVRVLRPDFEYFESPKDRGKRIDAEILHYTESQFDALDAMRRMPRVVFNGPAGTGKTLLAIEAARRAHSAGRRALLLCFNHALAEWLREQAAGLAETTTISDHMVRSAGIPVGSSQFAVDGFWEDLPQLACEGLIERPPRYDELIVDEAQDVLRGQLLDVLEFSLAGGLRDGFLRIFGDFRHQAIYDDAVDLDRFCADQGRTCTVFELDENCRNSPAVVALACAGGGIDEGYVRVMRQDEGDRPEVRFWKDAAHQQELLRAALEGLRAAGFGGPQVVVLSPRKDSDCVASTLTEQPWRDLLTPLAHTGRHGPVFDFHSVKTRYTTVHRFKGLEARAVVLTDIEHLDTPRERDLFYVGATRATQRLIVLAHESLRTKLG